MNETMCGLIKIAGSAGEYVYRDDLPIPTIGDDEVLIKIHCTSICGTDLHIVDWDEWSKKWVRHDAVMGHETAGTIVEVGKNVNDRKIGDRISCESHIPCNDCYLCKNGMQHICSRMELFGVSQDGAFAQYAKIRSDCTFLILDELSLEEACLLEPMGSGVHGAEAAEVQGKTVLISGCGPIGLAAVAACRHFGAELIIACDLLNDRLALAKDFGADVTVNVSEEELSAVIEKLNDGLGVDAAIDLTGSAQAIRKAISCLRAGGKLVGVGLPPEPVALDLANEVFYREVSVTGISGRRLWETWENFAEIMKEPYFDCEKLLGERFLLSEYKRAFERTRSGAPGRNLLFPNNKVI